MTARGVTDHRHPLDMLTPDEVRRAVEVLRASGRVEPSALFAHVVLDEPPKETVARWQPGDPLGRRVRALLVPGPALDMVEATVALDAGEIVGWRAVEGMRPALLFTEWMRVVPVIKEHPAYVAAMARRGVTDLTHVQIDPWPVGSFGFDATDDRRMARGLSFVRAEPRDNGYGRPVEGLFVDVDLGRGQVVDVVDHGVVPLPEPPVSYLAEDQPSTRDDLRPISIAQPEGPSFVVEGGLVRWQRWRFRLGFDHYEGLVLHQVAHEDAAVGRARTVLHRASVTEMVVPYGDASPLHGWKNAFDAGEFGLGRLANSLELGCDCVGEIRYFDATMATEQGEPAVISNAVCMHEEDYGVLWKHSDPHSGRTEVRRSRRLVVSSFATVGNYEYGFFWYFYLDGTIQLEVKLTGIVSPMAVGGDGDTVPVGEFANLVAPGVAAPHHQHLFSARLDFDVDGPVNVVEEVEAEPLPTGPDNPWANAFRLKATRLESELAAQRDIEPSRSRAWRISNPGVRNALGRPVAYKLVPTTATPVMLADPSSPVGRRAGFARHNLWVTPYTEGERRAAGDFPNQHQGGDGLPRWTAADRPVADTDLVCWYTFGVTHFARPEDWPVMPVEYCGFTLVPVGFFDHNPTLDVPPTEPASCHGPA